MRTLVVACTSIAVIAIVEIVAPGRAFYHYGWFNVAVMALTVVAILSRSRGARGAQGRTALAYSLATASAGVIAVAVVANGLFAPDTRSVVGAPGQQIRLDDVGGSLAFPLGGRDATDDVRLLAGGSSYDIGARRFAGSFLLQSVPRNVVAVDARDARGGRLTITQPTGTAFLSPVLLMQSRETIAGMNLPFDSFAVPAAHRIFKAVLFTPQEASQLRGFSAMPGYAVLLAADDETDQPLRNGIAPVRDGQTASVGGVRIHVDVLAYPSIEIVAIPNPWIVVLGIAGLVASVTPAIRNRSKRLPYAG